MNDRDLFDSIEREVLLSKAICDIADLREEQFGDKDRMILGNVIRTLENMRKREFESRAQKEQEGEE